jgi:hypothetical protein
MMSKPQSHFPGPGPSIGFVVAMRTRLIGASQGAPNEWIIVSRWGKHGENLSLGWTSQSAVHGDAPICLTPRQSAFAVRQERAGASSPATFRLAALLPDRITVAGEFVPAKGYIRLYGSGPSLWLRSEGECLLADRRPAWHVEATRASWIGEFFEARSPPP